MSSRKPSVRKDERSEVEISASLRQGGKEMEHRDMEKLIQKLNAF